jgi:FMN phosphatase YigB (HAD superfamily)
MAETSLRYSTVLFDWGDTVMRDHLEILLPMVEWNTIEVVEGIAEVLAYLHDSGRCIMLATSADISDEGQIRGALRRGGLDTYFSHIYCFKNTHLSKGEDFYRHILKHLRLSPLDVLMVGDRFEKDVQAANAAGIFAVWFNTRSEKTRKGDWHITVHSMAELRAFFKALDQN